MFVKYLPILCCSVLLFLPGPVLAVDFDHDAHVAILAKDVTCAKCHVADARDITPPPEICAECHDKDFMAAVTFKGLKTHDQVWSMRHGSKAAKVNADCNTCHATSDCLECHEAGRADEMGAFGNAFINIHRSDFAVTHPLAARTDQQLCKTCHEVKFCSDCHTTFNNNDLAVLSHRRGFTDGTLGGGHALFNENQCQGCHVNSVLPAHDWSNQHAREARKNLATCQVCHPEGDVCLKCHSATSGLQVNPHPADWSGRMSERIDRATGGKTCRKCH